jgi:hypothetical protein
MRQTRRERIAAVVSESTGSPPHLSLPPFEIPHAAEMIELRRQYAEARRALRALLRPET